jgi:adenylylsulfate kinase
MSFVIWFSGLPCSGKSVLSKKLAQCVPNMEILDGDDKLINALRPNRSKESRIIHAERIAHLAKLLLKHKIPVCASIISSFKEGRKIAREIIGSDIFIETYLKCSLEVCEKRDVKGMYKKARNGELDNFSGVTSPYEIPENPELIVDTENNTVEDCVLHILNYLKSNNRISSI